MVHTTKERKDLIFINKEDIGLLEEGYEVEIPIGKTTRWLKLTRQ